MRNIDRKKVSIIVPCYNLGKYLPEALDSVLAQTYDVWECVIVNDGSSDDTEQVSLDYCRRDGRFKYIVQENKGVSAARNVGIKESTGIFILPLDSDDILTPFCLEKSVGVFDSNFGVKLVYWDGERFWEKTGLRKLSEYSYDRILWENCIDACAMYKRADFDSTKGYDTNMRLGLEDWDFWLTLLDRNSCSIQNT